MTITELSKVSSTNRLIFLDVSQFDDVIVRKFIQKLGRQGKIEPNHGPLTLVSSVRDREKARGTFDVLSVKATKIAATILGDGTIS